MVSLHGFDIIKNNKDYEPFHPEVGFDHCYLEYRKSSLNKDIPPPKLGPIEPHEGREIGLMKLGYKSCAIIHGPAFGDEWKTACIENRWVYSKSEFRDDIAIAVLEEYWRIDAFHSIEKDARINKKWEDRHSVCTGFILGYTQFEIDYFIKFLKNIK